MAEQPKARIQVVGPYDKARNGLQHCRLDRDLRLDHNRIQASFPDLLTDIDLDLLTLAGAVSYTDRTVRRRRGVCWARNLEVHVPVSDTAFWQQPLLCNALIRCLALATGDEWRIIFTQLRKRRQLQPSLRAELRPFADLSCAIPFSGGLDSTVGLKLWQAANPESSALRIGTETNRDVGEVIRRTSAGWQPTRRVSVLLSMRVGSHPEPTHRTRTFLFFTTAALAAKLAGVGRVVVMENGQGALGPSLVPLGDEWPYRATHPLFTSSLRDLLRAVWGGSAPSFEHPHLWHPRCQDSCRMT